MIIIEQKPCYSQKFIKGEWDGHKFTIADYNGDVYVTFDQYMEMPESEHAILIHSIIKEYQKLN